MRPNHYASRGCPTERVGHTFGLVLRVGRTWVAEARDWHTGDPVAYGGLHASREEAVVAACRLAERHGADMA